MMSVQKSEIFGLVKTKIDAHTMGLHAAAALLRDSGYIAIISPPEIEDAIGRLLDSNCQKVFLHWITNNHISRLSFSYRLDPDDAVNIFGKMVYLLKKNGFYEGIGAQIKSISFAGLKPACDKIDLEYGSRIKTFRGGESAEETLITMGIPPEEIPKTITEGCKYDKQLWKFGEELIRKEEHKNIKPLIRTPYSEFGTMRDSLVKRLDYNFEGSFQPLIRAHSGPYSPELSRLQCIEQYKKWCKELASAGYLDVLSIGSSQLSQSEFGENWDGKINGGGVPVNSEQEYAEIWQAARPMLVRTYSATKNLIPMAAMYERTINISWHALSLWWFNVLDGRGPNSLYDNLKEHIDCIRFIAGTGKPVETNVPHHFAFRGCDDVTYIVSAYLAAKIAKKCGVKNFVLQNMLNTPRSTWGIQDLAKSRALLNLIYSLKDSSFRIILQSRAGLDYFKPNLDDAKIQLAAVTAMMDDIDPMNMRSPEIIHVVSYSEAVCLSTPDILNDSIKITRAALNKYRLLKQKGETPDTMTNEIQQRTFALESAARKIISAMEENIPNLYSPEGFYIAFVGGWLPVPELWSDSNEFVFAKSWGTKMSKGGILLTNHDIIVSTDERIKRCLNNLENANYIFKNFYPRTKSIL